jgi:hypothetical protein
MTIGQAAAARGCSFERARKAARRGELGEVCRMTPKVALVLRAVAERWASMRVQASGRRKAAAAPPPMSED